jgi:hypothetical protein
VRILALSTIGSCVLYHVDRRGWSEVEGVIVVVCMVIGDESCEVDIVMYVKDGYRVK